MNSRSFPSVAFLRENKPKNQKQKVLKNFLAFSKKLS